jgi:hypothetical protein
MTRTVSTCVLLLTASSSARSHLQCVCVCVRARYASLCVRSTILLAFFLKEIIFLEILGVLRGSTHRKHGSSK